MKFVIWTNFIFYNYLLASALKKLTILAKVSSFIVMGPWPPPGTVMNSSSLSMAMSFSAKLTLWQ